MPALYLSAKFRWIAVAFTLFAATLCQLAPASAGVVAKVDIARQRMTVIVDGNVEAVWAVSTARAGYYTPRGVYRPKLLKRMHYSKKYDNSPMPYSVFFKGGYAVHGTYSVKQLGRAASHGCIRLAPSHAAALYQLIRHRGMSDTRVVIG